jgi:hypothetical protein
MLIGFTGSRQGMTQFQKEELAKVLKFKECSEFMHGDYIGSDEQANQIALDVGVSIFTIHPPDNIKARAFCFDTERQFRWNRELTSYYPLAYKGKEIRVRWYPIDTYLKRNHRIVDQCSYIVATPKEFVHSIRSGTWSTIRYAWKSKKDIIIIPPIERPLELPENSVEQILERPQD